MKVLHLNAGNETGGGMYHILRLLKNFKTEGIIPCALGLFEKQTLFHRAHQANIQTTYFKNRSRLHLHVLRNVIRYIKEERISHIHTHGPRANVYMALLQYFLPIPWIVTLHSDPFFDFKEKGWKGKLFTKMHVQSLKRAHNIITVCENFQQPLKEAGINSELMTTIQNGIDFPPQAHQSVRENIRTSFSFTTDAFIFVKVARLEKVKGHAIAIEAFAKLFKMGTENYHLLFVGDGTLRTTLQQKVVDLGLEKNIHFFGEQTDVTTFYQLANVTLLCSFSESFPYVLLESAREKTPVIATDVGDVHLLISRSDLGWKVPRNNVDAMHVAMREAVAYEADKKLTSLGENIHAHAANKFSLAKCAEQVYNVYVEAMEDSDVYRRHT